MRLRHVDDRLVRIEGCLTTLRSRLDTLTSVVDSRLATLSSDVNSRLEALSSVVDTRLEALSSALNSWLDHQGNVNIPEPVVESLKESVRESLEAQTVTTFLNSVLSKANLQCGPKIECPPPNRYQRNCDEVYSSGRRVSGVYVIYPSLHSRSIAVYCEHTEDYGSWLVFQRRQDGSVNFARNWDDYRDGFGDLYGEFWLGNDKIHHLTSDDNSQYSNYPQTGTAGYRLRIELEDWEGNRRYAEYGQFKVGPESDHFRLIARDYRGNAGDSLTYHSNVEFSTPDRDHDHYNENCADLYSAGWWYDICSLSNLNTPYSSTSAVEKDAGIVWRSWKGPFYSLKSATMKMQYRN